MKNANERVYLFIISKNKNSCKFSPMFTGLERICLIYIDFIHLMSFILDTHLVE